MSSRSPRLFFTASGATELSVTRKYQARRGPPGNAWGRTGGRQ